MLSGDNSILNKAGEARDITGERAIAEQVQLAYMAAMTTGSGTIDETQLRTELDKYFKDRYQNLDITNGTVDIDGKTYNINGSDTTNTGGITISLEMTHQDVAPTVGGNVDSVNSENIPIPEGFYAVAGTQKSTGFVISSEQNDDLANTKGGDQFVWVPVDQNQKLKLQVSAPENITAITLTDPTGANISVGTFSGKTFTNENINPTYNGEYKVEVTAGETKTQTLVVRSLYAQDTFNDYFTDEKIEGDEYNKWNSMMGNPNDIAVICQNLGLGSNKTMDDFKGWILGKGYTDPITNSNTNLNYANSVNTNGGFYIGRFEAGKDNGTLVSKIGVDTYNNVKRDQAKTLADGMYSGKSYLITNAAWDRTLGWIINSSNNVNLSAAVADSSSWGNYSGTSAGNGRLAKTGVFGDSTKVNNIYDLAGNVYEWTSATSPITSGPCVIRGGVCYNSGSNSPASLRGYYNESIYYDVVGFRVALFL